MRGVVYVVAKGKVRSFVFFWDKGVVVALNKIVSAINGYERYETQNPCRYKGY